MICFTASYPHAVLFWKQKKRYKLCYTQPQMLKFRSLTGWDNAINY